MDCRQPSPYNPNPKANPPSDQVGLRGWTADKLRRKTVEWLKANGDRPMDDGKVSQRTLLNDCGCR